VLSLFWHLSDKLSKTRNNYVRICGLRPEIWTQ